jgi:hypothetical protein
MVYASLMMVIESDCICFCYLLHNITVALRLFHAIRAICVARLQKRSLALKATLLCPLQLGGVER